MLALHADFFWTFLPRWLLQGLFLLVMAGVLLLAYRGHLWGIGLLLSAVSYLGRCFDETWPEASEAHVRRLLAQAQEAQQAGHLNRAMGHARTAKAMAESADLYDAALARQAELLLLQGHGAAALRALSRTSPYHTPSASLRVRAHLQTGESSVALALARRMFARAPTPATARLIAQALLQLQRPSEARHFASLAADTPEELAAATSQAPQRAPAPPSWELPDPPRLWVAWTGATTVGGLLACLTVQLPWIHWGTETLYERYGYAVSFVLGAGQGGLVALAQAWVLRRFVPEPKAWPPLTALGAGLGMVALSLLIESGEWWPSPSSPWEISFFLSLKNLLASCWQILALGRWRFRTSAVWVLAALATAPLAEFAGLGAVGLAWHPSSPFACDIPPPTPAALGLQALLSTLARGLVLGVAGGALLHREWARIRSWRVAPPPRPLAPSPPRLLARSRPPFPWRGLPAQLPVVPLRGPLFCPGADASFELAETVFKRHAHALFSDAFVIIPSPPEAPAWPGGAPPTVGMLATVRRSRMTPGEDSQLTVRMLARVHLQGLTLSEHGALARITPLEDVPCTHPQAQLDQLRYRLNDYIRSTPDMHLEKALGLRDPVFLADFIAASLQLSLEERRALLEELDPEARIARVCAWLDRELLEHPRPPLALKFYVSPTSLEHTWDE